MIRRLRFRLATVGALASTTAKSFLAYSFWFWAQMFGQVLAMVIFVSFWEALYAGRSEIGGMGAAQTITYILLAQMVLPLVRWGLILDFGYYVREGLIAVNLLRPMDFQAVMYVNGLTMTLCALAQQAVALGAAALLLFDLSLPSSPAVWLSFGLALLLGNAIMFCFDWLFACLAFYTTEAWGLQVVREALVLFFSGALLPLALLPEWLQSLGAALPFAQALYVPVAILSGIIPLEQAPQHWLIQLAWLGGLWAASRLVFGVAVRKVTVQGG